MKTEDYDKITAYTIGALGAVITIGVVCLLGLIIKFFS